MLVIARPIDASLARHVPPHPRLASWTPITAVGTTTSSTAAAARSRAALLIDARDDPTAADGAPGELRDDAVGDVARDLHQRVILANVDLADLRTRYVGLVGDGAHKVTRPCIVHRADVDENARHGARRASSRMRRASFGRACPRRVA